MLFYACLVAIGLYAWSWAMEVLDRQARDRHERRPSWRNRTFPATEDELPEDERPEPRDE